MQQQHYKCQAMLQHLRLIQRLSSHLICHVNKFTGQTLINQSINLYCTPRGRIKNKINEIKYNNTAHIKYTSETSTIYLKASVQLV